MHQRHIFQPNGLGLVIGAAVIWGTIGVATQAIYQADNTSSLFINLTRMLIASPVLLVACWQVVGTKMFHIRQRDFVLMLFGGTLLAISQAAYFAAIRSTGVTIATLLAVCLSPLLVTFLAVLLKFETLSRRMVIALICALFGSVLLVGLQAPEGTDYNLSLGTILSVISAVCYAGMIICWRFLAASYHPLQVTAVAFGGGTLALLLINLASGVAVVHSAQGWLLVAYLGLVPTAFAYLLFQMGLRSVSATAASIITMLEPLVAALLAWVLFGETLAPTGIVGAVLLVLSIFLLTMNNRERKPAI